MAETLERRRTKLRDQHRHDKRWQKLTVLASERLNDQFVRVTFDTGDIAFESHGFDDVLVLYFPLDALAISSSPPALELENHAAREYTVLRVDPVKRSIVVDFLLHEVGVATQWARTASAGQVLWSIPTRMCKGLPEASRTYIFADASAVPAVRRFHDEVGEQPGQTVLLGVSAKTRRSFARTPRQILEFTKTSSVATLVSATDLARPSDHTQSFIWIAGEAGWAGSLRRRLTNGYGISKENIQFTGYWRL